MSNLKYIGKNILNHDLILKKGDVSGSASSTGSFGNLNISSDASITGDMVVGGKLTAEQFHTEITSASIIFASGSTLFGDTQDDTHIFTGSLKVTGSVTALNLTADSSSVSTRLTTEEGNVDALQADSGSFSTRVTNLKADSGSFSTRTTTLEAASASFSTRVTTAETELELTLISGSAQIATQISGAFDTVSSSLSDRLQTAEIELENTLISGSAQLASQISGAFTDGFEFDGTISGSATSTGSFGKLSIASGKRGIDIGSVPTNWDSQLNILGTTSTTGIKIQAPSSGNAQIKMYSNAGGSNNDFWYIQSTNGGTFDIVNYGPGSFTNMVSIAANTGHMTVRGNVSGSATSTGSFGRLETAGVVIDNNNVSATSFTGIFQGALSGSAQIASNISGAFAVASASFAVDILSNSSSFATRITADSSSFSTRVTDLKTDSGSFSTRVTDLKTDSGSFSTRITANSSSFAARDTLSEATSSKILNGKLEFTNITGSGHISMSLSSTGSFGRVSLTALGGHSPFVIDSIVTASSAVQFNDKIFIQTGSIEGDLHVRTNDNFMRIGKSTSGLFVSGSETISRFATGSDGSIIDLGFTVINEDGGVVLAGDGDGIHVDSSNYWYNNKFYKIGDGSRNFLRYEPANGLRYKGELTVNTGSFEGNMFINSPTGSMFIGKYTGGIPTSGSDTISRFATGSDGSIIDLGFTTTDEEGETVFLTTGDGVVVDSNNYWYTTGHFKVGNGEKQIEWNTTDLNVSASTVDVTTLKASDVNFSNLPTSDPLVTGSLWVSGSSSSGSYKSGFVMISGIHG